VKEIDHQDGHARVVVKVTAVLGKSTTSKPARAWSGAWVTCTPELTVTRS
jgi:hypothetical protein